ncbi:hypothetical protein QYE76_015038 [Lolium multiflorum]|uniref:RNase H type-1 domain-containing protein n=1 Tax=Lolium multiflorum TaxID=4521 RepID=A0AAD8X6D4_LOLMU|nr:hypothetical protein QYE76_015038 [Lolium multiflorum]
MNSGKFQSLQAKLAKCLVEWDDNHKSQAAKEVLIKAIAQAIPFPDAAIEKGKMVLDPGQGLVKKKEPEKDRNHGLKKWSRPGLGHAKLNTDGAFKPGEGARIGMVLRDHDGAAIFTACRALEQCNDATEAELIALEEGLKLALLWLAAIALVPDQEDVLVWQWSGDGQYSSKSAYEAFFAGMVKAPAMEEIWCSRAPYNGKFWLAAKNRC